MTVLYHFESEERKYWIFSYDDFQVLKDLMPEKNHEIVSEIEKRRLRQQSGVGVESKSMKEKIMELKKLVDIGVLT